MENKNTNAPRTGNDAQTAFGSAVRLADQITSLDMDSATKERVAATRLIQAALEGRDRMHNERHAALVAALEKVERVIACYGTANTKHVDELTGEAITPLMVEIRAALAAAKTNT